MRLIVVPVQFRTIAEALASRRVDLAVTVADELPSSVQRLILFRGGFVCLFDPRHARLGKTLRESDYFAHDHVIVSYNADLRGVVEDVMQKTRRVRCSLSSFNNIGAIVDGSALLATVPAMVAGEIRRVRPHLRTLALPFGVSNGAMELLWPAVDDDDAAGRFLRAKIIELAKEVDPDPVLARSPGTARSSSSDPPAPRRRAAPRPPR
jgi:LysR family transcriptional activator of mexEF-oprN operon